MGKGTAEDPFTMDDIKVLWWDWILIALRHPAWFYKTAKYCWQKAKEDSK